MYGPPSDDDEIDGEDVTDADLDGLTIGILYADASGALSERTIRCRRLRRSAGLLYIDAECLLRHAYRTFRFDRIQEVRDYSTGEILEDVNAFFAPYLGGAAPTVARQAKVRFTTDSASTNPRVAAAFRDGARVLLFIAISDGELHQRELSSVVDYGVERLRRLREPPRDPESIVRRWVTNHVPSRASAFAALGRIMVNEDDGRELAHRMVDLIIADGTATDGEMAIAWKLQEAIEGRERYRPAST